MTEFKNNIKNHNKKAGRTIIVRTLEDFSTDNIEGVLQINSVRDNKYFIVFDTIQNAKNAFKLLKSNPNISVRFAYYRIFFTMEGINKDLDYSNLKKLHTEWLSSNSLGEVLYYKQYMKDNLFLGCGDFTVDTKESMDKLLNKDELKTYSFDGLSGTYYRFNKKGDFEKKNPNLEVA